MHVKTARWAHKGFENVRCVIAQWFGHVWVAKTSNMKFVCAIRNLLCKKCFS